MASASCSTQRQTSSCDEGNAAGPAASSRDVNLSLSVCVHLHGLGQGLAIGVVSPKPFSKFHRIVSCKVSCQMLCTKVGCPNLAPLRSDIKRALFTRKSQF